MSDPAFTTWTYKRKVVAMALRYFVYLSDTKVQMLFPQLPQRLQHRGGSVSTEVKVRLGVFEASARRDPPGRTVDSDRFEKLRAVCGFLQSDASQLGTLDDPRQFFAGRLNMNWGSLKEYGADIVFFGGETARTTIALVGSRQSIVGEAPVSDSGHALDYYLFKFLSASEANPRSFSLDALGPSGGATESYLTLASSFNRYMGRVANRSQRLEFVARTLFRQDEDAHQILIGSPLYVAVDDLATETPFT